MEAAVANLSMDKEGNMYYMSHGCKVFADITKHPQIPLQGNTYHVLVIGMNDHIPYIIIESNKKEYCYRLPEVLYDWANTIILQSVFMGIDICPCDINFGYMDDDRIYAEIL